MNHGERAGQVGRGRPGARSRSGLTLLLRLAGWAACAACAGCGEAALVHDLPEREANEVLVALDEGGLAAGKVRGEGTEAGWTVTVARGDEAHAQRLLAARELPRARPQGLGEVFAQGGMVPTPVEEHARWLHALSGELARSVEALDGVIEARVHLGLPLDDALRPGVRQAPRASVLVKCRPAACAALRGQEAGLRALVAGAADGLSPEAVAVVIAEGLESAAPPSQGGRTPWTRIVAALALLGAAALGGLAWRTWRGRRTAEAG
jgi:type III secretion protein J